MILLEVKLPDGTIYTKECATAEELKEAQSTLDAICEKMGFKHKITDMGSKGEQCDPH